MKFFRKNGDEVANDDALTKQAVHESSINNVINHILVNTKNLMSEHQYSPQCLKKFCIRLFKFYGKFPFNTS